MARVVTGDSGGGGYLRLRLLSFFELLSSIVSELSRLFFMRGHPSMKLQDVVK